MSESREDSVYLAKLAEQAERYEGECGGVARVNEARVADPNCASALGLHSQRWSRT